MQATRAVIAIFFLSGAGLASGVFVHAASIILPVPFTSQAPLGNWASPWQDFCEEASVVMAAHFIWGISLTPAIADLEMRIIKRFEELVFGRYKDTSIDETALILTTLYGFSDVHPRIVTSAEDIRAEIAAGRVVIMPANGRKLGNPYFVPPGPRYHMLLVRGFDDEKKVFITNDPGTRRGNNFLYSFEVLFEAIHDWNGGDVERGEKKILAIGREKSR